LLSLQRRGYRCAAENADRSGTAPQADLDNAIAGRDTTQARLDQAKAVLRVAEEQVHYTELDANFDGVVAAWVVLATVHRVRPILLTAAAASLGMIPIARQFFWGPMAYAMIGVFSSAPY
jgi:multidrug efflux pump subunit AcrB